MVTGKLNQPLVAIVGPTASGKTAAAIALAKLRDGEIISADSRTVYRGMDIGTAKPSEKERAGIPHWGFDLTEPGVRFSAAQFQAYAVQKIAEIRERGRLPIMVGGTGLYVDGVLFDYRYPAPPSAELRAKIEMLTTEELYKYCVNNNIELPINDKNKRHLARSILQEGVQLQRRQNVINNTIVVGIATEKSVLDERFKLRAEQMFNDGVAEEAKSLGKKYGWDSEAMTGNIYPLLREYIEGKVDIMATKEAFAMRDRQLAKRQMTWFRRNPWIVWNKADQLIDYTVQALDERAHL